MTANLVPKDGNFRSFTRKGVGWRFFTGTLPELVSVVYSLRGAATASTISVCNVHMFIEAARDAELGKAISATSFAICDGQPIAWLLSLVTGRKVPRITGPDFFEEILLHHLEDFRVALIGGSTELPQRLHERLGRKSMPILLVIDPGMVPADGAVAPTIVAELRAFRPDIVFVGLGCPKQEKWISNAAPLVRAVYAGVGAAFEYLFGDIKRAPSLIGQLGLEWLYRLIQQPRLFRRYASSNLPYLLVLAAATLNLKRRRPPFA